MCFAMVGGDAAFLRTCYAAQATFQPIVFLSTAAVMMMMSTVSHFVAYLQNLLFHQCAQNARNVRCGLSFCNINCQLNLTKRD